MTTQHESIARAPASTPIPGPARDTPRRRNCRVCGSRLSRGSRSGRCAACCDERRIYLPTPDEIRAECERIRAGWDASRFAETAPRPYEIRRVRIAPDDRDDEE